GRRRSPTGTCSHPHPASGCGPHRPVAPTSSPAAPPPACPAALRPACAVENATTPRIPPPTPRRGGHRHAHVSNTSTIAAPRRKNLPLSGSHRLKVDTFDRLSRPGMCGGSCVSLYALPHLHAAGQSGLVESELAEHSTSKQAARRRGKRQTESRAHRHADIAHRADQTIVAKLIDN